MSNNKFDTLYMTEDCKYDSLLISIKDYLEDKNNPINNQMLGIFNSIMCLFRDTLEYTDELNEKIFDLIDKLGYYDDVKKQIREIL